MKSVRTFIGVPVTPGVSDQLQKGAALLARLNPSVDIRWVKPENYHLTIAFLGNQTLPLISNLQDALAEPCQSVPAGEVEVTGWSQFPDAKSPIVAALIEKNSTLATLYQVCWQVLQTFGFDQPERTFKPHITVGRMPKTGRGKTLEFPVCLQGLREAMRVDRLIIYQSELSGSAPHYKALHSLALEQV